MIATAVVGLGLIATFIYVVAKWLIKDLPEDPRKSPGQPSGRS